MSKAVIIRLVDKYKTKGAVETEQFVERPKNSTDRKIIKYMKKNSFGFTRDMIRKLELDILENIAMLG